ncbi:hypothetical protein DM02DRAFT_667344 [Periconia macrospinosa]|uniref:Uncharacterized protein n=1 Tax=Periconia macrospinosa TaxID=97972 RepID=A0A2V1EBU9_9PLEO|nr:hypothetical protein DM02DRAFT_667344 [Periconia macrospinosa]
MSNLRAFPAATWVNRTLALCDEVIDGRLGSRGSYPKTGKTGWCVTTQALPTSGTAQKRNRNLKEADHTKG